MTSKTGIVLAISCGLLGPVAGVAPLGLAPLLHLTGLGCLVAYRMDHGRWPVPSWRGAERHGNPENSGLLRLSPAITNPVTSLCLLASYVALSCLWASAGIAAWEKLPELMALGAWGLILPVAVRDLPAADVKSVHLALLAGLPAGMLVCFGDILAGAPLKRWHKHLPEIPVNAYDREIVTLGLMLWPAALILYRRGMRVQHALGALSVYTVGIMFLESHSAMVGMAIGIAALCIALAAPAIVRRGLVAVAALGFLVCIPVGLALQHYGLDQWQSLQFSFRHRIQIWHFTAERILHWPLFGLGLEGSRAIPLADLPPNFLPLGDNKPPLHPHNFFLQIWLELGAAGAGLTFLFMTALIDGIKTMAQPAPAFALAAASAFMGIASFAFGIWQGWWLAALVFLIASLMLAAKETA